MAKVYCKKCIYYYVTWSQDRPHGCKAYGFESKTIPSLVVFRSSKSQCLFFQERITK